jgi:glycosyltransferase involved in cell wall biosynthesis
MSQVVVVTPDVVGERMAGAGIRAYHLACEIGRRFPTALVANLLGFRRGGEPFEPVAAGTAEGARRIAAAAVVVGQPTRSLLALRKRARGRFCFDLFDLVVLELRELYGPRPRPRQLIHYHAEWSRLRRALQVGEALLYAAPRQRDFYAGVCAALSIDVGEWISRSIEVPFGCEIGRAGDRPPCEAEVDEIVWGGGLWEWLDPDTAAEAVRLANDRGTRCRLRFLGGAHPNPAIEAGRARFAQLAAAAPGLVAVTDEWVPYRERIAWLRGCKVAIMLHRATGEAEYSIRTRFFDALTAGLPVIATRGGFAADLVERESLGLTVPPSDARAVADAAVKLLGDDVFYGACVNNIERVRPRFAWPAVAAPLVERIATWMPRD